ncbi:MAG: hypothetical protein RI995_1427, partial [Bacteroidota bacterium]
KLNLFFMFLQKKVKMWLKIKPKNDDFAKNVK